MTLTEVFEKRIVDHPICERCKSKPSVAVTSWGKIQAVCTGCADAEQQTFHEATTIHPTGETCPQCGEPYLLSSARVDSCKKCGYSQGY